MTDRAPRFGVVLPPGGVGERDRARGRRRGRSGRPAAPEPGGTCVAAARSARALGVVCAGLVAAAVLLWGATAAVWYVITPAGRPAVELAGAQVTPAPGAAGLLALAGAAAVVAAGGPLRRAVGVVIGLVGVGVGVLAVRVLLVVPFATDASAPGLPQPPAGVPVDAVRHQATVITAAPLLALAGAALLAVVGAFVLVGEPRLARLGARYERARPPAAELDPDRAAWRDLDAGRDPTVDRSADPADGPRSRPG